MSVIVKGIFGKDMPMPQEGYVDIRLHFKCGRIECATMPIGNPPYYATFKVVELPPHGRLIDADKFAETLKEVSIRQGYDKLFSDNILSVGDVFDAIAVDLMGEGLDKYKLAPTVIEAEGETK